MASGMQIFTSFLVVSIFYSVIVSLLVPVMPYMDANQVASFTNAQGGFSVVTLSQAMQSGVTNQTNIPLLAFGALVFYSSNIIINLMVNFFTAIPQMITIMINTLFLFAPQVDIYTKQTFLMLFQAIVTIIYMIAVLTFIMGARGSVSGGGAA